MGKLKPRLGSRKNAKRWRKGESSISNPETMKHRNQARSLFFQGNLGSSALTTDVLRKHDILQGTHSIPERIEVDANSEDETCTTFKTFNTFASDYSNCSNVSFSRFLNHFQTKSVIHKEMLAILAAVAEVIKEKGGTESSTEYYAALMTTLESANSEEAVAAILSLLGMVLKTVPVNVLKWQFSQASQIFLQVLTKYAMTDDFLIQRHCIGCLSILLRAQGSAVWSDMSTLQVLDSLLAFTIHAKPRVRKAAQHGVCAVLKGSDIMKEENAPPYHPAARHVAEHCLTQLETAGKHGHITSTLYIISLLKEILHQVPKSSVKSICERLFSIMTLKNNTVWTCCFQTFLGLFVSRPNEAVLPAELNAQIINALYDYQPSPGDTPQTLAWLRVMQEAFNNLAMHSLDLCAANVPCFIEKCKELWLSKKQEVLTGASHAIKHVLEECVRLMCENEALAKRHRVTLTKTIQLVQEGMSYQYNEAWLYVIHLLGLLFQIIKFTCQDELVKILSALADLRDSHKFTYISEIEYAVGAAVKSMGPEVVLNTIPLDGLNRSWLLPVLKDCISHASLAYFIKSVLPLAKQCEIKSKALKESEDGIGAHSYELMRSQIWSLLPSFCNNPFDIKDSFEPNFARVLGDLIRNDKNLRLPVMASLRKLINHALETNNQEDIKTLAKFSKNYLPILFNFYSTKPYGSDEEGQRLAAFETIKLYLSITSEDILTIFFKQAMTKIQEETTDEFEKECMFDLLRLFAQFTDISNLKTVYDFCVPLLSSNENQKEQKKAYRFLEDICSSEAEVCKKFVLENRRMIQSLLRKTQDTVQKSSKGARIRCMISLVKSHPQLEKTKFLQMIVPEAVMCLKELNEKCRISSYELLNVIAEKFLSNEQNFKEYIELIVSGLAGVPIFCSATLLALSSLTYNYNGSLGKQTIQGILTHVCNLITGPTREITLSSLGFIKVYLTVMPTPEIGPNLPKIVEALSKMTDDCKRHFRQKVRDIFVKMARKFGIETITAMVPKSDETMHKRLKNIRKIEAKKQKVKEERDRDENGHEDSDEEFNVKRMPKSVEEILADSDEDFEDTEMKDAGKNPKQPRRKTWIQESEDKIVDFVDPTVSKNIYATKPGTSGAKPAKAKAKDIGFKTAPDGRLIITDDNDDESDEEGEEKKKIKSYLGLDGDDDDDESDEEGEEKKIKLSFGGLDGYDDDYGREINNCTENNYDDNYDETKSIKLNKSTKKRKHSESGSVYSEAVFTSSKYKAGGSGIHRPVKAFKTEKDAGIEYRAKKAKGDIKKKGKVDPYAYVPLTKSSLNKRKKMKTAGRFKNIISGAKKGAKIGRKNQKKMRGN